MHLLRWLSLPILILPLLAQAATHEDFFCVETPLVMPTYYAVGIKNCGDGKRETVQGVCTQTVSCAYVSPEVRALAKSKLGREWAALPTSDRVSFLKESSDVEWFPTTLTCRGHKNGPNPVCPAPEQCKEDIYHQPMAALTEPADLEAIGRRHQRGADRTFQHQAGGAQ